jgi:hypothetical protein
MKHTLCGLQNQEGSHPQGDSLATCLGSNMPSLDTHMCSITPSERAAPLQCADPHLEALKPPNPAPLEEPGGAGLGLAYAAKKVGAEAIKRMVVNTYEPWGALLDVNGTPAPTQGTTSIELAGGAVKATTAQPEALDPWAKGKAWHGLGMPPLLPLRKAPTVGRRRPELPPPL